MRNYIQRIITIDAKSLFKYFPKRKNTPDQPFCFDTRKRTLFALVAKQNDFEECPMLDQFLEVLKEELGDKFNSEDEKLLYDKFLIMDFDDIFMPIKDDATEAIRKRKEELQNNVKDLMKNGFKLKVDAEHEVHMMPFDKSGNMSRNGRISFVNKEYVDRLNERLNLGMDFSKIKVILSKYYAYRGLYLSTSQRVNYDKFKLTPETVVIIKDTREASGKSFERDVKIATAKQGKTKKDWKFQKPEKYKVLNVDTPYDGEGFITPAYSKYINEALGVKGANSFQIRLPFAKGMLHEVDVIGFIKEYTAEGTGEEQYLYKDAFGIERDLRKAHIFLTESMFKGKDWLFEYCKKKKIDPMKYYCEAIAKYNHGFYVSGTNLPYGHSKYTHLSYQTINTLAFNDKQFENIINGHGKFIKEPIEFLKKWDEIEREDNETEDIEVSYYMPNWKRALFKNPSIASNKYIKEQLKNTQKSLVSKIALGKVLVEGQTRYLCRDLAPLLNSLLRSDIDVKNAYLRSLYTRFYLPQGKKSMLELKFEDYYAFFRYPHLSRNEQYIMRAFVLPEDKYAADGKKDEEHYRKYVKMYDKYFGHLTGIVMIPRGSTLPLCLGGADFDGDLVSVVLNKDVVDAVVKGAYQWQHSDSLYYYTRKIPAIAIPGTKAKPEYVPKYVEYDHIYNTFSNYIGQISNTAISIGQAEYDRNNNNVSEFDAKVATCDKCTILTGLEIDAAKNGVHPNLDLILKSDVKKSVYLSFLREFKDFKSEEYFDLDKIEIKEEKVTIDDVEKDVMVICTKNGKTEVKWSLENEESGTYINLLPKYFSEYYKVYKQVKSEKKIAKLNKPQLSKCDKELIEEFQEACDEIIRLYLFYKNKFMKKLTEEKKKGYFAVENVETQIMLRYDEECVDAKLFETIPSIRDKIENTFTNESTVKEIRERIKSEQWLFQPSNKRGQALEKIIGNGFKVTNLTEDEREILCHFKQQGYKMLWRIMDLIEGPSIASFESISDKMKKKRSELEIDGLEVLESLLIEESRRYYEENAVDVERMLYAHCIKQLRNVIGIYKLSVGDFSKLVVGLYDKTKSSASKSKIFWDVFTWEEIQFMVEGKGEDGKC